MNTYKKLLATLLLCILFSNNIFAQDNDIVFTEEDKKEMQVRVKQKVEEFQGYLSDIVNSELTVKQRENSVYAALALFMGKGDPYTVINEYGEKERRNAVRMQISSLNNTYKKWSKMKKYLWDQYNKLDHIYDKIEIQSADVVRVDNIHRVGKNRFQAVAYYCQRYVSYRDGKRVYGPDISGKKITVHIQAIDTPKGYVWDAKFGDIYVTSTQYGN